MSDNKNFSFLLFSDLHSHKDKDFNLTQANKRLIDFLRESELPCDYLFIAGDIANQCDYTDVSGFMNALRDAVSWTEGSENKQRIFWAVGNHDIKRGRKIREEIIDKIRSNDDPSGTFEKRMNDEESRSILTRTGMSEYITAYKDVCGVDFPKEITENAHRYFRFDGKLNLFVLNTCLTSCDNHDDRNLFISENRLHALFDGAQPDLPTIVIGHHGKEFFHPEEERRLTGLFQNRVDLYLCGHSHRASYSAFDVAPHEVHQITCGGGKIDGYAKLVFIYGQYDAQSKCFTVTPYSYAENGDQSWGEDFRLHSKLKKDNNNFCATRLGGEAAKPASAASGILFDKSSAGKQSVRRFRVALSFPGEYRSFVEQIADGLSAIYGRKQILYDKYHQAEFARPNLDTHLQNLYRFDSDLIVVFICADYQRKKWCGLEWRAIRDLLNQRDTDDKIMFIRCDDGAVDGFFGTVDGYIDVSEVPVKEITEDIITRLGDLYGLPQEPQKTQKSNIVLHAIHNLPARNPAFTDREKLLHDIEQGLKKRLMVIITGQGGFGKSQTAVEYAYRHINEYKFVWVFNAESEARLIDDYRSFAVHIAGLPSAMTEDFELVHLIISSWLLKNSSYLFIYENAEDLSNLRRFLPHGQQGHILIVTRESFTGINAETLSIMKFSLQDSLMFLEKKLGSIDKADAETLARNLDYLPLALDQAAAYIMGNNYTISGYINLLKKHGHRVFVKPSPDSEYGKTVLTTWVNTLEKIKRDPQTIASLQLFKLMAFCAPDDIPLQIFIKGREKLPQPLQDALDPDDPISHDELIGHLKRYSLVSFRRSENGQVFLSVHRLMQAVVAGNMEEREEYLRFCLDVANTTINKNEFATREDFYTFAVTVPHMSEIARHAENVFTDDDEAAISIASIYHEAGYGYNEQGDYPAALVWYSKALAIREKVLGAEHPLTAASYNNIAFAYCKQGDFSAALEWHSKALAIHEKVLGAEHPDTAKSYNNIACVYVNQGDYPAALEWYNKALVIREKVLGVEHTSTATSYNNIAYVYENQGDYTAALELYNKALVIDEKVLGAEHPSTATSYNNIAGVYNNQGDYTAALELYNKALVIDEKVLGKEHPSTALSYNNIGFVCAKQGNYPAALEWYNKALAINKKVLGAEHPSTATSYNNIASVYCNQGDYPAALEWYSKALAIREKVLGVEHPGTAASYNNIAAVYDNQGDYLAALEWHNKAQEINEKVLGSDHPHTQAT